MALNYTLQDVFEMVRVLPFFGLVLLAPGYMAGFATNILSFRARGAAERILLALALSCSISPYIINLLCRFLSVNTVSIFFVLIGLAFLTTVLIEWKHTAFSRQARMHWTTKMALGMVAAWGLVCLVSLPDLQFGQRLYSSAAAFDHCVRTAFIASAMRTGAPPSNPFFYPGAPVHLRYFYYWNVLCAVPAYLSGANPRVVLYVSCFWSGLCLMAVIPLYLKYFGEKKSNLRVATVIGFGLLAITGLDIFPTFLISLFHTTPPYADMEWWDPVQVASWFDSLLWVPHHVASLVACLSGFLFLWNSQGGEKPQLRISLLVLAAVSFSSGAGLSVYVTFTFALFVIAWVLFLLASGKFVAALLHVAVGMLAILLSSGYLADLLGHAGTRSAGTESSIAIALRPLPALFASFPKVLSHGNWLVSASLYVLFLVLTLFLEFGVYFAIGWIRWKEDWKHRSELPEAKRCLWLMCAVALLVTIFLRSTVIDANDLAWRSGLIAQFVLLLWTSTYLADRTSAGQSEARSGWRSKLNLSWAIILLIVFGAGSSLYQLFMLRSYTLLSDELGWKKFNLVSTGEETFSIRESLDELHHETPANAIVQANPWNKLTVQLLIYSRYQEAEAFAPGCGVVFGGTSEDCAPIETQVKRIFDPDPANRITKNDVDLLCSALKINRLIVESRDPVWNQPDSWVWHASPMIQNGFVRVYRCGADR